jgi:SNF2 family DNA or RNA helicase
MKREVVKELPPRTDVVLRCTLDEQERALYESVRAAAQKEVVEQLAGGGSVLAALEALLRLRQACCHRALLPGQTANRSSKLDLLFERLDEALSEGHKALVFSQWTSLLDLIEPHLESRKLPFARLDGSTPDRGAVVRKFQEDPQVGVMLLSLKAGGVGLNLTAADHVFLLDPWWNPAAEDQAADRAHRIGQERPVLVHRLVASDSVEERILLLQEQKRALSAVATGDEAAGALGITRDDLLALLA